MPTANGDFVPWSPTATNGQAEACPVAEEAGPPCTTKANLPGAMIAGQAWWQIIGSVIDWCQQPGASIRSGDRLTADAVCTLVGAFIYPVGDQDSESTVVQGAIRKLWDNGIPDFDLGGMLTSWNALAAQAGGNNKDRLLNVLAVRAVLRAVADGLVGWTRTQDKSDQRGISIGI